jgi:eukaryotic-like serine/threonine-protein kinase
VSEPDRSDLLLGWNLAPSEEKPALQSDQNRSKLGKARGALSRNKAWDDTRSIARPPSGDSKSLQPAADFTLHPDFEGANPGSGLTGVTPQTDRESMAQVQTIPFPRCGEGIGGFRLVSELGRGAFGRVYLAEESGLGNRPVALKVTRPEGEEPRLLARLQHTHIVPIHSVVDDPESGLRLMCMPYFGGANLAQVLEATGHRQTTAATGLSLVEALDVVGSPASRADARSTQASRVRHHSGLSTESRSGDSPINPKSASLRSLLGKIPWWSRSLATPLKPLDDSDPVQPARRFLRESSFVRASAWIAARLAEGLEHAHSRGLLHRDLKPSNILIAADGTPMLLDFNLAADSVSLAEGDRAMVGGTLPYMAPEHLDAFNPNGSTPPEAVDERADVYALGLILFEMIAGQHPFPEPPPGRRLLEVLRIMTEERRGPAPSPRALNPEIPRGLDAIVRKCIDPDPDRRHARAGDLAEDLRRFLDDRPLKYTPEPSVAEQVAKWARRNPKITGAVPVALISVALILSIVGTTWTIAHHFQKIEARLKLHGFESKFQECQFLLNIANGPSKNLGRGIGIAEKAIAEAGVKDGGKGFQSWVGALSTDEQASMRSQLAELLLLTSRARVFQAELSRNEGTRRRALEEGVRGLDRAEQIDPHPPQALYAERARYHSALGEAQKAARDRSLAEATPPITARDYYLLGTSLLSQQRPDKAETALLKAVELEPDQFWGWFSLGLCHFDQSRFDASAGDFTASAMRAPRFAWPWMNRGLALARAGRLVEALVSYNQAIQIDGRNAEALACRGLISLELDNASAAVGDLEKAVSLGLRDPSIRAGLGQAMARAGRQGEGLHLLTELIEADPDANLPRVMRGMLQISTDPKLAEADFRHVLTVDPKHPVANLGMARLLRVFDPSEALPFVDLAMSDAANRIEALELRAWLRGRLGDPRAIDDVNLLIQTPTRYRLFNAACALALLSESQADPKLTARALELIRRALDSGFPIDLVRDDPDLKSLRSNPAFRKLIEPEPR